MSSTIPQEVLEEVWERDKGLCQLWHSMPHGEDIDPMHMEEHRGMGGDPSTNVPSNITLGCRWCHNRFHGRGAYRVIHFDPDDLENGLIIESHRGRRVPKERLWFYNKTACENLQEEFKKVETLVSEANKVTWRLAAFLSDVDERGLARAIGDYENVVEMGATFQISGPEVKKLIKLHRFMERYELDPGDIPLKLAQVLYRAEKRDKLEEVLTLIEDLKSGTMHIAQFWEEVDNELRQERTKKAWIGKGKIQQIELSDDIVFQKEPDQFILKGGSLVAGIGQEED